ncbi:pentatricopeptide repeat-containing protein [Dorcoceras hygrometricum]|uniref:Pentatricopeptide repeat-containing protein n=1 Tax=Dorcoceras hygrometricum TaxID=472368 RepID=A0A2Z7ANM5_9LAMI|nr:pentatricopeptide repeat-containing protein [Dorcoceras hygrometricum]
MADRLQLFARWLGDTCATLGAAMWRLPPTCGRRPTCSWQRCDGYFLLGFVRACPGQPMKFSGRYSISCRFWSILKF